MNESSVQVEVQDTDVPARPGRRVVGIVAEALVVAAISGGLAVFKFRAWRQSYWVALMAAGTDQLQMASVVRSIHDTGWYFTNPHLGAPFGQQLYDFPQTGESLQIAVLRVLTLLSHRPFWVMNVYFLAGFAVLAFVTYLVLAHLRFRFWVAAPVALLYTWLPYHLMHGEFHFFRSTYLSAPISILIIFWVFSWKDRFLIDPDGPVWGIGKLWSNLRRTRVLGAISLCVFVGSFETMVMAFMLVTLVVSALIVAFRNRDIGDLAGALVAATVVAATFGLLFLPNFAFKHHHGPNTDAAKRYPAEQVIYGLQLSKMVLPVATHPVKAMGNLSTRALDHNPTPGEAGQNLGLLGTLGFLALLVGVIVNRLDVRTGEDPTDRRRLWVQSGLITLILVLFATMSGFALVLSLFGLSQIRVWDRAVILIAFCALLMVAIALEKIGERIRATVLSRRTDMVGRSRRILACAAVVALAVAVTFFGMWDTQTTYASSRTNAAANVRAQMLRNMNVDIARHIGSDGMVFQLPIVQFPESPPRNEMQDYEGLLPYLYSDGLRFSYGAMRGRPEADWQLQISSDDPRPHLAGLVGLGFDGILVDSFGYSDRAKSVSAKLTTALGPPVVRSSDGRWIFWNLQGYAHSHGLTEAQTRAAATAMVGPDLLARLER